MKTRIYNEDEFNRDCEIIAGNIKKSFVAYDKIVALGRGGIPLGARLSALIGVPVIDIPYSLKDTTRIDRMQALKESLHGYSVLIVDDISDSGKTLEEVASIFDGEFFHTATLVFKPQTSHYRPTYLATIHMGDEWVVFPWEEDLFAQDT